MHRYIRLYILYLHTHTHAYRRTYSTCMHTTHAYSTHIYRPLFVYRQTGIQTDMHAYMKTDKHCMYACIRTCMRICGQRDKHTAILTCMPRHITCITMCITDIETDRQTNIQLNARACIAIHSITMYVAVHVCVHMYAICSVV